MPHRPDLTRTKQHFFVRLLLAGALIGTIHAGFAQTSFDNDFDDEAKPWEEIAVQLPAPPLAGNLLPFEVSGNATQSFAIDTKSLTVGSDGVIRYTLVATSASGVQNISYEGIRCASFEKKLYAFGHTDGSWSRARHSEWRLIVRNAANRQHAILFKDFFCSGLTVAGNAQDMLNRIRWKRPLTDSLGD